MSGPFVHSIDPIIGNIAGVYLWYYGLSYSLGFLSVFRWLRRTRAETGLSAVEVYEASMLLAIGILFGGRFVEVAFYEWSYYADHPLQIAMYWLGGMSTHGILLGAIAGVLCFCRIRGRTFLSMTDELAVPGAFIMGLGRLGNFIDGQIMGAPTDMWWGVVFPDTDIARHPVVLYDGIKNLLIIPLLLWVRRAGALTGIITAHFIFWYGFLRIFVDLFREYRVDVFGLGPGQIFNLFMTGAGIALFLWVKNKRTVSADSKLHLLGSTHRPANASLGLKRGVFALVVVFPLMIPSDWTQDVPARYGKRHSGLEYSWFYPRIVRSGDNDTKNMEPPNP